MTWRLITLAVVCPLDTSNEVISDTLGQLIGYSLPDPKLRESRDYKILYWENIEFSYNYNFINVQHSFRDQLPNCELLALDVKVVQQHPKERITLIILAAIGVAWGFIAWFLHH